MSLHLLSHAEQVAAHLHDEILAGRWKVEMPGVAHLKKELGVNHVTINAAFHLLEERGILTSQGPKRRRRISLTDAVLKKPTMRIRVLLYDQQSRLSPYTIELLDQLHQAGFSARFARKTLIDLGMDLKRVVGFVGQTEADAWIVVAGSREILSWFADQPCPSIAMFGRFTGVKIASASPRAALANVQAVRRLVDLGHRRIVMLVRKERREPTPALVEQVFLDELKANGLEAGRYNLPDWDDHPEGFLDCLDALFKHTPPTALFCGEPRLFAAAQQHLARKGIHAPEDVSLICSDADSTLSWCRPAIAHVHWEHRPVIQRVVRWAKNAAAGKPDIRQTLIPGKLIEGGTIGPAAD